MITIEIWCNETGFRMINLTAFKNLFNYQQLKQIKPNKTVQFIISSTTFETIKETLKNSNSKNNITIKVI